MRTRGTLTPVGTRTARACYPHGAAMGERSQRTHGTPARLCTHRAAHGCASPCAACACASLQRAPWLARPRWHGCPVQWPCRWVQGCEAARTRARREPDTDPLREVRQGQGSPLAVLWGALCRASHPTAPLPHVAACVGVRELLERGGQDRRHVVNTANCRGFREGRLQAAGSWQEPSHRTTAIGMDVALPCRVLRSTPI